MSNVKKPILFISIDGLANYYLKDPHFHMPNLQSLIEKGVVAESMKSIFPTATWAIHTSLVTGCYPKKHGVLGNWVYDRKLRQVGEHFGDVTWTKEESVFKKTIYDLAQENNWTTASICWPKTREASTIDYNIPEYYKQELFDQYCTKDLWEELKAVGLPVDKYGSWSKDHARGHMQDWLTTEIAIHLIRNHQPDLLMMHYLLPDSYQHDYGTRSKEVYWSLQFLDEQLGKLFNELKTKGSWDQTNIFVVSDHGFVDTLWTFSPNVLFKKMGWLDPDNLETAQVIATSNGGSGYVYVLEQEIQERNKILEEVKEQMTKTQGVKKLYESKEFASLGLPDEDEFLSHRPDFVFEMEKDYFIHFQNEGNQVIEKQTKFKGMHGYSPNLEEMKAMFVAHGPTIREGITISEIQAIDVAPTIARLIGNELSDIDGREITELWKVGVEVGNSPKNQNHYSKA
ncbi:alkaline phosphatase family protein [Metabacillus halosaccharovorans]|uniref:alkaline phosphatase family protein n=1 Tax=Metabacillus halosaccharovorans TaxID=930124 RepID=UPI00203F6616|nr:ectonucleotide pyrophosphatase/phosphodiesterase [Metabacillus halosaccharovorans]MCM3443121.1 ectonucleotide pyrophosphatase/phosphodiesterase [Metabacillus halosaccharovorans]